MNRLILLAVACVLTTTTGCVERMLHVTSDPPGAIVYLNDVEVGRTPVAVPFRFYGTYDVRLEAEGHRPMWTSQEAKMPWWELPGPDLVAEALPDGKNHIHWHFAMQPQPAEPTLADEDALIDNATQMRDLTLDRANE